MILISSVRWMVWCLIFHLIFMMAVWGCEWVAMLRFWKLILVCASLTTGTQGLTCSCLVVTMELCVACVEISMGMLEMSWETLLETFYQVCTSGQRAGEQKTMSHLHVMRAVRPAALFALLTHVPCMKQTLSVVSLLLQVWVPLVHVMLKWTHRPSSKAVCLTCASVTETEEFSVRLWRHTSLGVVKRESLLQIGERNPIAVSLPKHS